MDKGCHSVDAATLQQCVKVRTALGALRGPAMAAASGCTAPVDGCRPWCRKQSCILRRPLLPQPTAPASRSYGKALCPPASRDRAA